MPRKRDLPRSIAPRLEKLEKTLLDPKEGVMVRLAVIEEKVRHIEKVVNRHDKFFIGLFAMLFVILIKLLVG